MTIDRARELDAADPLAPYRNRFALPAETIYLDGNSLGCLPKDTPARIAEVVAHEWGCDLIGSWNTADWIVMPQRIGGKIAPLIGAAPHEVIACDTVSVNLFKLIAAALKMQPGRTVVLSEPGNFPTDLYMIEGLEQQGLAQRRLAERDRMAEALDGDVALPTLMEDVLPPALGVPVDHLFQPLKALVFGLAFAFNHDRRKEGALQTQFWLDVRYVQHVGTFLGLNDAMQITQWS